MPSAGTLQNPICVKRHCIGSRIVAVDSSEAWINIPRCASSTLKKCTLPGNDYVYLESIYQYDKELRFTTIIRDPWRRYLSGLAQALKRDNWLWHDRGRSPGFPEHAYYSEPWECYLRIEFIYESVFETGFYRRTVSQQPFRELNNKFPMVFDEHTAPFSIMLAPFRKNEVEFIEQTGDLSNLVEELKRRLNRPKINSYNIMQEKYHFYQEFLDYFEPKLKANKEWIQNWNEVFAEDYWIYENRKIRSFNLFEDFLRSNWKPEIYFPYLQED